eukprot:1078910-Pelagomonas_calceolata.AAC.1
MKGASVDAFHNASGQLRISSILLIFPFLLFAGQYGYDPELYMSISACLTMHQCHINGTSCARRTCRKRVCPFLAHEG